MTSIPNYSSNQENTRPHKKFSVEVVGRKKKMEESSMELYTSLKQGLEDIENGNTRPFSEALSAIKSRRDSVEVVEKHEELVNEITEQIELARNQGWLAGTVEGACAVIKLLKLSREESINLLARACRLSNLTATDMYEKLLKRSNADCHSG